MSRQSGQLWTVTAYCSHGRAIRVDVELLFSGQQLHDPCPDGVADQLLRAAQPSWRDRWRYKTRKT